MYSLVTIPTTTLRKPSELIRVFDAALAALAKDMNTVMVRENGVGLAAPQIGKNIQLIVVKIEDSDAYKAYVNPKITFRSAKKIAIEEGCLSVPGTYGYVQRAAKIRVSYHDTEGVKHNEKAIGMAAIVLQHEIDHINGTLIIDHPLEITKKGKV